MKNTHRYIILATILGCTIAGAQAQNVYRVTQPDGRVVFTDTPQSSDNTVQVRSTDHRTVVSPTAPEKRQNTSAINTDQLPYQVKRAHQAYPVTLFTANNCSPCTDARNYLTQSGIPFTEYTVTTAQDMEALKRETAQTSNNFPVIKIGNKVLVDFRKQDWENYLNAAGYPKTNQLPSSYTNPAPQPLTTPEEAKPVQQPAQPQTIERIPPKPTDNSEPSIRF